MILVESGHFYLFAFREIPKIFYLSNVFCCFFLFTDFYTKKLVDKLFLNIFF